MDNMNICRQDEYQGYEYISGASIDFKCALAQISDFKSKEEMLSSSGNTKIVTWHLKNPHSSRCIYLEPALNF